MQFLAEGVRDGCALAAESRERSHGAAKLQDDCAALQIVEAFTVTMDCVEPASNLKTESGGERLLHPGAAYDESGAIFFGEIREGDGEAIDFGFNFLQCCA